MVFQNQAFSSKNVLAMADHLAADTNLISMNPRSQRSTPLVYTFRLLDGNSHHLGWFKFNVDGSVRNPNSLAACGGVCRDDSGKWVLDFCRNLGSSNILVVEFWGILTALKIAWDEQLHKVILESDSATVINLINNGCDLHHPYAAFVTAILSWKDKF